MMRYCGSLAFCVVLCWAARADDPTKAAAVKQTAQQLADATIKEDFARVIDQTYPAIVKELGGRAKAIEATEAAMKVMKAQGMTIKAFKVGEAGEFLREGANTFVVVSTTMEAVIPGAKVVAKSYLLGISPDDGKTWTFADGSGLGEQAFRDKVLPKLPASLKLPAVARPEIIRDE